jgi:hypothetical protein
MTRQPLSPEAKAAAIARLHEHMRKACERMETNKSKRQSELDADELAEALGKIADEMGANV